VNSQGSKASIDLILNRDRAIFKKTIWQKVVKVGVVSTDERDHLSGNTVLMVADDCPQRRQRLV